MKNCQTALWLPMSSMVRTLPCSLTGSKIFTDPPNLQYFNNQVHSTLTHPLRTINEEDANIFFKGALQIYVEFWNSRKPLVEYIPYVPKPLDTVELQINSHINEMWSLLSYIKSAIYFPCVSNLHSFEILDKLNRDLTNILEQYFYTNIWSDWKDISALYPQCSPPFRMENTRAYMCTICDIGHFITRKEKHEYLHICVWLHRLPTCTNQTINIHHCHSLFE